MSGIITGQEVNISKLCERIAQLDIAFDALVEQATAIGKERDELKAQIMREVQNGSSFVEAKIGNRTIYVAAVRRPKPRRSRPQLVEALKAAGLGWLVKEDYNENTLYGETNAWVKTATDNMDKLAARVFDANGLIPEALREDLALDAKYEIRVRK
jgi:crotonobetainyl-CoA:carnitine CoA-transferase CaiB-like acyl-CoA transferase